MLIGKARRNGSLTVAQGLFWGVLVASACAMEEPASDVWVKADGKDDSSYLATILDLEFDGELTTDYVYGEAATIESQLLYTIGHLNGDRAVGRLDRVVLSDVQRSTENGKTKITYHAKIPVAWGSKTSLPSSYSLRLPRDVSSSGLEAFASKYKTNCVDEGAHDVDSGSMWYYYRPNAYRCSLNADDVVTSSAHVEVSTVNTTGKYPEYHKVWEDNVLKVVAIFGKYEDGATGDSDSGIAAYNEFVRALRSTLGSYSVTTIPSTVPNDPGVAVPDITFQGNLGGGRTIQVVALLVDNVRTADPTFNARYEQLSTRADLIGYNGHAGLGANVRALAQKGSWTQGQYVIFFMNGCDTYAYVDGSLAGARAAVNPDDPTGTKYMEIVTNAMPAYFVNMADGALALISGLMNHGAPSTYENIFREMSSTQIVLVTGEQDNVYYPGYTSGGGGSAEWTGIDESFTVSPGEEKRWQTPSLAPGAYEFTLSGDNDADLYVRIGEAPTSTLWDCRPYTNGSDETCAVNLSASAPVHVLVMGYAGTAFVRLMGH